MFVTIKFWLWLDCDIFNLNESLLHTKDLKVAQISKRHELFAISQKTAYFYAGRRWIYKLFVIMWVQVGGSQTMFYWKIENFTRKSSKYFEYVFHANRNHSQQDAVLSDQLIRWIHGLRMRFISTEVKVKLTHSPRGVNQRTQWHSVAQSELGIGTPEWWKPIRISNLWRSHTGSYFQDTKQSPLIYVPFSFWSWGSGSDDQEGPTTGTSSARAFIMPPRHCSLPLYGPF